MPRTSKDNSTKVAPSKATGRAKGGKKAAKTRVAKKSKENATDGGLCHCGCGEEVVRNFRQGHDSRFHGLVKKIKAGSLTIEGLSDLGVREYAVDFYREASV